MVAILNLSMFSYAVIVYYWIRAYKPAILEWSIMVDVHIMDVFVRIISIWRLCNVGKLYSLWVIHHKELLLKITCVTPCKCDCWPWYTISLCDGVVYRVAPTTFQPSLSTLDRCCDRVQILFKNCLTCVTIRVMSVGKLRLVNPICSIRKIIRYYSSRAGRTW